MFNWNKKGKNTNENDEIVDGRTQLEKAKEENEELYAKLTNKNRDYMFQLDRRLDELGYDQNKKVVVINQMLNETVEFQAEAITARRMYGTVTERTDKILGLDVEMLEEQKEQSPTWMRYMDGALLLGGLFTVVNGLGAWRSPEETIGLLQLLMNFLLGGLAVLALTKYRPTPGEKKGMFKYVLATTGVMFVWVFAMSFTKLLAPSFINPILPPAVVIGVGVIGVLVRWYLKQKWDIQGTLF